MLDTNTFGKLSPSCNAVPVLPLLRDCMYQIKLAEEVRHGLSCEDERGGNDFEPHSQYIRLKSLRDR